jgi:hypothetical protein
MNDTQPDQAAGTIVRLDHTTQFAYDMICNLKPDNLTN